MQPQHTGGQNNEHSTPNSGNKRYRTPISSPSAPPSQSPSPSSSPVAPAAKKLMMAPENKSMSQPLDIDTMKALLAPINQQLAGVVKGQAGMSESVKKIEKSVSSMVPAIQKLQSDVERLKKQLIRKSLIITGIEEKPNESYKDIDKEIEKLSSSLGLPTIDYDMTRRVGKPILGKSRPIELVLLRQRDKMLILSAKTKLRENAHSKNIYINSTRTETEQKKYKKLLEFAKQQKSQDSSIKFRFTRGGILEISGGSAAGLYYVDANDKIENFKGGEDMDQGLSGLLQSGS